MKEDTNIFGFDTVLRLGFCLAYTKAISILLQTVQIQELQT